MVIRVTLINTDYQLDKIYSHPRDKSLGMPVREFLDWVKWDGHTYPKYGQHIPWAGAPRLNKKGKWVKYQHSPPSASWPWIQCDQLSHASATINSPPWGMYPQTVSQNKSFLLWVAFIKHFVTAIRKATNTRAVLKYIIYKTLEEHENTTLTRNVGAGEFQKWGHARSHHINKENKDISGTGRKCAKLWKWKKVWRL